MCSGMLVELEDAWPPTWLTCAQNYVTMRQGEHVH